jgi:DNA-binding MarR family transcriptional regulator
MESLTRKSIGKVMKTLYEKGELYASQLAREAGITVRHLDRILPRLAQDSLIEYYKERGKKYCKLTEKGEALVWALLNPDVLTDLYKGEKNRKRHRDRST